jgi:hypothetical protein
LRAVRPAFITGLVVSSLMFAVLRAAGDPWLGRHGIDHSGPRGRDGVPRGEQLGDDDCQRAHGRWRPLVVDRTEGAGGGPSLIILAVMNLAVLAFVWLRERSRRTGPERGV